MSLIISFLLFPPFSVSETPIVGCWSSSTDPLILIFCCPSLCLVILLPRTFPHLLFSNPFAEIFILALTIFNLPGFFSLHYLCSFQVRFSCLFACLLFWSFLQADGLRQIALYFLIISGYLRLGFKCQFYWGLIYIKWNIPILRVLGWWPSEICSHNTNKLMGSSVYRCCSSGGGLHL